MPSPPKKSGLTKREIVALTTTDERRKYLFKFCPDFAGINFIDSEGRFRQLYIDGEKVGNITRFINHANPGTYDYPDGNCRQAINVHAISGLNRGLSKAYLVAQRDIIKGEELRLDYGSYFRKVLSSEVIYFLDKENLYELPRSN